MALKAIVRARFVADQVIGRVADEDADEYAAGRCQRYSASTSAGAVAAGADLNRSSMSV
jgi:hypothetical protein